MVLRLEGADKGVVMDEDVGTDVVGGMERDGGADASPL